MKYELVIYSRATPCPYVRAVKRVLEREDIPYREILIDKDPVAEQRVIAWTGFKSVPTVIVARPGEDVPYQDPAPLTADSPRNVDRGSMITEPGEITFENWLRKHGFIE